MNTKEARGLSKIYSCLTIWETDAMTAAADDRPYIDAMTVSEDEGKRTNELLYIEKR